MKIREITPVFCNVCGAIAGKNDCGALAGSFDGKRHHLKLCQACFLSLIGAAKEMRGVSVMFTNDDAPSDDFGLKQ